MEFGLTSVASYWHLHLPQGQASAYKGSSIDHGLSADAIEASAVLQEDSRPQAILKLQPPNSLDYSTHYGCHSKDEKKEGCKCNHKSAELPILRRRHRQLLIVKAVSALETFSIDSGLLAFSVFSQ